MAVAERDAEIDMLRRRLAAVQPKSDAEWQVTSPADARPAE
jgi:hypothetical protein